ncbi:MAG: M23 family metallopeptidase, partial [Chloroflexi bacterium]|nr:M23 family metallopeptidase [Chloroflexota bacterium]
SAAAAAPSAGMATALPAGTPPAPRASALTTTRASPPAATPTASPAPAQQRVGLDCVVPVLRRHPIELAPYEAASGRAGDVQFVSRTMGNVIYTQFGYVVPAAITSSGQDKSNPQPTYLAPLGTPVRAAATGVVDRISELWSTPTYGDVSVMIRPDGLPAGCYLVVEAEHVLNPRVAVGDRVTAGQVIAEVGALNSQGNSGLGLVELGILTGAGNGRPMHVCPYAYFAPDVAAAQLGMLTRLMADWESYAGDPALWDESAWVGGVPGCSSGPITE